jgi:hyaluronan synthase
MVLMDPGFTKSSVKQTLFWSSMFAVVIFSLLYLKWMALWRWRDAAFYAYSVLVTSYILCRFGLAGFYKPGPRDPSYTPSVSVVIPVYNEEEEIEHTVRAWLGCDYPSENYQVIVVNDGSMDRTWPILQRLQRELKDHTLIIDTLDRNQGKKQAQVRGFSHAKGEIIVVADSDSFPENPNAIREIVQPFADPKVGGACGHTDVANTRNWLGKMQKLRYWSAFDRYKRSESVTGSVICLSGCFSAVRRSALDRIVDEWLRQRFLGHLASYGDDRALTTLLLKYGWNTVYAPSAKAKTIVPENFRKFWNQQMRWEKSYIRETLIGSKFMWKRPLAALEYYVGAFVTWGGFVVAAYTIWYKPIVTHGTFTPWVYLFGLTVVSMLYAINYRRYNKDRLWVYAPVWGIIYAAVLVWRFPLAIIDLHKSDWKTR